MTGSFAIADFGVVSSRLPCLADADRFFCFALVWWDGKGFDAGVWVERDGACRRLVVGTGETSEWSEARVLVDEQVSVSELEALLTDVRKRGFANFSSQTERTRLSNHDEWFGLKHNYRVEAKWLFVAGGGHRDPDAQLFMDHTLDLCPELFPIWEQSED